MVVLANFPDAVVVPVPGANPPIEYGLVKRSVNSVEIAITTVALPATITPPAVPDNTVAALIVGVVPLTVISRICAAGPLSK